MHGLPKAGLAASRLDRRAKQYQTLQSQPHDKPSHMFPCMHAFIEPACRMRRGNKMLPAQQAHLKGSGKGVRAALVMKGMACLLQIGDGGCCCSRIPRELPAAQP
jgi:hypothetical protein